MQEKGRAGQFFQNAAAFLVRGQATAGHLPTSRLLPTYDVFDEARYFTRRRRNCILVVWNGRKLGRHDLRGHLGRALPAAPLLLGRPGEIARRAGRGDHPQPQRVALPVRQAPPRRYEMIAALAAKYGGALRVLQRCRRQRWTHLRRQLLRLQRGGRRGAYPARRSRSRWPSWTSTPRPAHCRRCPRSRRSFIPALTLGLHDYFAKCGFKSAVLGLSGGIDSAVTAALAVEALGAEYVTGVAMPEPLFKQGQRCRCALAGGKPRRGKCLQVPISEPFEAFKRQFATVFAGLPEDTTEENMQARLRGMVLMSLSNKFGSLLLTTGNKSELAVGYCTLYGDMAGGLAVISDVPKTSVYRLAELHQPRAGNHPGHPPSTSRPSAELKPDQKDQDSLPPYDLLDQRACSSTSRENLSVQWRSSTRVSTPQTVRWGPATGRFK